MNPFRDRDPEPPAPLWRPSQKREGLQAIGASRPHAVQMASWIRLLGRATAENYGAADEGTIE